MPIVALALGLLAWSPSAAAQQPRKIPLIGILSDQTSLEGAKSLEPFAQGLRDLGYIEGQNIAFERRYAMLKDESLAGLASELVRLQPEVILAVGTLSARAAKTATQTIPIVFARVADPVGSGLVPSLARPGGNLTGFSVQTTDLVAKRLELLITAVPDAKRVGALWDPSFPAIGPQFGEVEGAARSLSLDLVPAEVQGPDDFEPALRAMLEKGASALLVLGSTIVFEHLERIIGLTIKARLPAMFFRREAVEAGGLMSYAADFPDSIRRAAAYVDKILTGAKPADLPVQQPTRFELVVNLKTAKALGLTLPPSILTRADEVIE